MLTLVNSTCLEYNMESQGEAHVYWYLDLHVTDLDGLDLPYANITTKLGETLIGSLKANNIGWATNIPLLEKTVNATGEYFVGNHTIVAAYESLYGITLVNMVGNQQIDPFIIPEFTSFLILPLFMIVALLTTILFKERNFRRKKT